MDPAANVSPSQPIRFGKFWLIEKVASGGMAEIYKAVATTADGKRQILAIKRILPQYSNDEEFVSMLVDEAKLMVLLNHPNIVPMMEFGKVEDSCYIAMEFVEGITLKSLVKRIKDSGQRCSIDMAVHIAREIGTGLAYAHRKVDENGTALGIVHRDISPTNILISFDGDVKIADFGISKASNQSHRTQIGVIRGKTGYMSPEQTKSGAVIDQRSDLYSLGIIFFELLTGQRLYQAESIPEALRIIRKGEIPSIRQIRPEVPESLEIIALKALTADVDQRYQRADAFVDSLNEFLIRWNPTGRPVRVTHSDLVGFLHRYYSVEMSQRFEDATGAIFEEAATYVDSPDAKTVADTLSQKTLSRPHTIVANPLYELSEQEFDLPPTLSGASRSKTILTSPSGLSQTQSLQDAMSASLRIVGRFSPFVISGLIAGALVFGSLVFFLRRSRSTPPVAAVPTTPVPVPTPPTKKVSYAKVKISTDPRGARVYLDQVLVDGSTPLELPSLQVGNTYAIKIVLSGYETIEREFTISQAMNMTKKYFLHPSITPTPRPQPPQKVELPKLGPPPAPKKGKLSVSSDPPGASIYVDGKLMASEESLIELALFSGNHRIKIVSAGGRASWEFQVLIKPNQTLRCAKVDIEQHKNNCRY